MHCIRPPRDGSGSYELVREQAVADCEAFVAATLTPLERVFGNLAAFVHDNSSESQHFGSNFEDSYSKLMGESYEKEVEWDWVKDPAATNFLPLELVDSVFAARLVPDGNCFNRALSQGLFGSQTLHLHIRLVLLAHLFVHRNSYIQGEPPPHFFFFFFFFERHRMNMPWLCHICR